MFYVMELVRTLKKAEIYSKDDSLPQIKSTQTERVSPGQIACCDVPCSRNPQQNMASSLQHETTSYLELVGTRGDGKKSQKPGKQGRQRRASGTQTPTKADPKGPSPTMGVRAGPTQGPYQESFTCTVRPRGGVTAPSSCQLWSNPGEHIVVWAPADTCQRPLTEYRAHTVDLTVPGFTRKADVVQTTTPHRLISPPQMAHSVSSIELCALSVSRKVFTNQITSQWQGRIM
ncbi:uncharacterized protein LOC143478362 [Brachyhypopomus gauderio]|uniref:uncharacterized protein LOC143478362 n=1 Tax=Brachyhypopomus gauderio TaxID=698409 RepID=UPI004042982C